MRFIKKVENEHVRFFGLLLCIFVLGAVADCWGWKNFIINLVGIFLQLGTMPFMIFNMVRFFDSGLLAARKATILNIACIVTAILAMTLCWYYKMVFFMICAFVLILFHFVLLIISMCRLSITYLEVIKMEKEQKNVNDPKGTFRDFFDNF